MAKKNEDGSLEFQGYKLEQSPHNDTSWDVKDERNVKVASVNYAKWKGKEAYYYLSEEAKTDVGHRKFPDKELAFHFIVAVIQAAQKEVNKRPLPEDVMDAFNRRARSLRERGQQLHSQLLDLQFEQYALLQMAKKYGVDEAEMYLGDSDIDRVVQELLEFKVVVGKEQVPFFSESALYELIGKDDARSVLGRMRRLMKLVAPAHAEKL